MGFPLGPVQAIFFIVELENTIILYLKKKLKLCIRHNLFSKKGLNECHTNSIKLNSNIKFTTDIEKDSVIAFLDTLIIKIPKQNTNKSTL